MRTLKEISVNNKRVLLRVDLNVSVEDGAVKDDFRLRAILPTINYLRERGAKTVILSHLGRPKGKPDPKLSLKPVGEALSKLAGIPVKFAANCIGPKAAAAVADLGAGEILLCENLRFYPGEEANDPDFAGKLAELGDIYINDAFGAAHRSHASIVGIPQIVPSAAGLLMQKELEELDKVRLSSAEPMVIVLGGAKVKTKIKVVEKLLDKSEAICLGGIIANTLLAAKGVMVGKSFYEKDVSEYVDEVALTDTRLHLPLDVVVSGDASGKKPIRVAAAGAVGEKEMILDIGPDTVKLFSGIMKKAKLLLWNGPMGLFEVEKFAQGTYDLARVLKDIDAYTVIGGGDIIRAVSEVSATGSVNYISTGGGAMLEYLAEGTLPGLEALENYSN